MRRSLALFATLVVGAGCASVIGVDFDTYKEGVAGPDAAPPSFCPANSTSKCLCGLNEGTRTCDAEGKHETVCQCPEGGSITPAIVGCGNGTIEENEACDDSNTIANDGCSALCVPDGRPAAVDTCPGQVIALWPSGDLKFDIKGFVRAAAVDAGACGNTATPDRIYSFTAPLSGTIDLVTTSDVQLSVSVRTTCASTTAPVSCDAVAPNVPVTRKLTVKEGTTYYLVIEPKQVSATANYSIELKGP
jgi:cysteine-rich repeat protein